MTSQHLLGHLMNGMGVPAFVHLNHPITNPAWRTPMATAGHIRDGIVIYPESIEKTPLKARRVVRWLRSRPGYITGRTLTPGTDATSSRSAR